MATVLALSGCAGAPVTKVNICSEIPFLDGPEGACANTVTRESKLISAEDWKKMRPYMLMIHVDDWSAIRKDWLRACRIAGPDCNVQVESVDKVIKAIDKIVKSIVQPQE